MMLARRLGAVSLTRWPQIEGLSLLAVSHTARYDGLDMSCLCMYLKVLCIYFKWNALRQSATQ